MVISNSLVVDCLYIGDGTYITQGLCWPSGILPAPFRAVFRAIFDLSNKIALLILLWMYALYVKKKQKFEQKF